MLGKVLYHESIKSIKLDNKKVWAVNCYGRYCLYPLLREDCASIINALMGMMMMNMIYSGDKMQVVVFLRTNTITHANILTVHN